MEITQGGTHRPFIIRRNQNRTLIPIESEVFDEKVESYVRFVQGANAFISFFEVYEIIRVIYLRFAYSDQCGAYSHFLTALACLNAFWILVSLVGISSINSRQSFRVTRFLVALFLVAISRIVFYVVMEIKMSDVPANSEWYCDAVYQGGLYIITAILEAVVIIIAIFLTWIIKSYIQSWEESQKNTQTMDGQYGSGYNEL